MISFVWAITRSSIVLRVGIFYGSISFFAVILSYLSGMFILDYYMYVYLCLFFMYIFGGLFFYLYWGYLGTRGLFYSFEIVLISFLIVNIITIYIFIRLGTSLDIHICDLPISESFSFHICVQFSLLNLIGICLVTFLTCVILTFALEYLLRELIAYDVISTLFCFSASIIGFMSSNGFGLMVMCWELSGTFSLLLVDMYYSRVRTTQAASRTFAISRFSDYVMFLAMVEIMSLCGTDYVNTILDLLPHMQFDLSAVGAYFFDCTSVTLIIFSLFAAAATKSAQFLLFVWLPDAMEAPTPASALIHSSTLVVMGIFLLLKFSKILYLSPFVLNIMSLFGALTILYGALCSVQTSDLKKAVAYSTISQIGYLFCGCGLLAFKEVLIYLVLHAICKALLFVLVGYIVHVCGGTTSMKKMGGLYTLMPDVSAYMFILCMILGGAPYTIGFFVKELIIYNILSGTNQFIWLIIMCWMMALIATPFYLYRICICPLFGAPKESFSRFKRIYALNNYFVFTNTDFVSKSLLEKCHKYSTNWQNRSKFITIAHCLLILSMLLFGEYFILLTAGFVNPDSVLFADTSFEFTQFALNCAQIMPGFVLRNFQIAVTILFITISSYFYFITTLDNMSYYLHFYIIFIIIIEICVILAAFGTGLSVMF